MKKVLGWIIIIVFSIGCYLVSAIKLGFLISAGVWIVAISLALLLVKAIEWAIGD